MALPLPKGSSHEKLALVAQERLKGTSVLEELQVSQCCKEDPARGAKLPLSRTSPEVSDLAMVCDSMKFNPLENRFCKIKMPEW